MTASSCLAACLVALALGATGWAGAAEPSPRHDLEKVKPQDRRSAFRALDADGDGWISRREAQARPEVAANFDGADRNGDGRLDFEEFETIPVNRTDQPGMRPPDRG